MNPGLRPFGRVVVIVLDSCGVGALPDAGLYGDQGANTLAHVAGACGGLSLPTLGGLGLGRITTVAGVPPAPAPAGAFGKMRERSPGKDSTTGHWELMGVVLEHPFPTYPHGFPPEVIEPFEARIGRRVLGNRPASGTVIIAELGAEHLRTGRPIVYTSADSVFQVAAHEERIPVDELYRYCEIARGILTGPHAVGRVIARPFVGQPGAFVRTDRRRDFSLPPPAPTVLDALRRAGQSVVAIGKIADLFAGRGVSATVHTHDDAGGMAATLAALERHPAGLIFTNLVDLDTQFGHRNNARGYGEDLQRIDGEVAKVRAALRTGDILVVTADHGNDPTTPSTDHSREYVPLLVCGPRIRPGVDLGARATFADVGATVAEALGAPPPAAGQSVLRDVMAP